MRGLLLLLAAWAGGAHAQSAPAAATARVAVVRAFKPRAGTPYRVRITGETGSLLDVTGEAGIDARPLAALAESLRRDGERRLSFDFEFEERWIANGGGWRIERRALRGSVVRSIAGRPEAGPLPIDYVGLEVALELGADGNPGGLRLSSTRLGEEEREILAQFFALEPFPAQPGGDCALAFTRAAGAPWYRITDRYSVAAPRPGAEPACDADVLTLDRSVSIPADLVAGTPELATAAPARFALRLGCDGETADAAGEFELGFVETMEAPPEFRTPAKKTAAATPAAPPQIRIAYRLPTRIRVVREGGVQGACP